MVARGIRPETILEEHRAMNTGENVMFSLPVIGAGTSSYEKYPQR